MPGFLFWVIIELHYKKGIPASVLTVCFDRDIERESEMEMISIIIPIYNEEEAIGGDLDTIIQT
ncbi:MAG: hypothetical protein WBW48_02655, partial [Anaerolineae bacterium]